MTFLITEEILVLLPPILCNRKSNTCNSSSHSGYFSKHASRMATLISTQAPLKRVSYERQVYVSPGFLIVQYESSCFFLADFSWTQGFTTADQGLPCLFLVEASPQTPLAGQIRHAVFKRNVCFGAAYTPLGALLSLG